MWDSRAPSPALKRLAVTAIVFIVGGLAWAAICEPGSSVGDWRWLGMLIFALGFALAMVVGAVQIRRLRPAWLSRSQFEQPKMQPWSITRGSIAWISVDPLSQRRERRWLWLQGIVTGLIVCAVVLVFARFWHQPLVVRVMIWPYAFVLFFLATSLVVRMREVKRVPHRRIGTDGMHLYFDAGGGSIESVPLDTVRVDANDILVGRHIVPLRKPYVSSVFPLDALRGYVLARLRAECFVRTGGVKLVALGRGNPGMIVSAAAVFLVFAVMVLLQFRPDLQQRVNQTVPAWVAERIRP